MFAYGTHPCHAVWDPIDLMVEWICYRYYFIYILITAIITIWGRIVAMELWSSERAPCANRSILWPRNHLWSNQLCEADRQPSQSQFCSAACSLIPIGEWIWEHDCFVSFPSTFCTVTAAPVPPPLVVVVRQTLIIILLTWNWTRSGRITFNMHGNRCGFSFGCSRSRN